MTLSKLVPALNQDLWFIIPERARTRATILLEVCTKLATVQNGKRSALMSQEAERLGKLHMNVGGKYVDLPASVPSLKRIFRNWQKADRSWTQLVQTWDLPSGTKGREALPQAFIEKWQSMVLAENRKSKPAYRKLIALWRNGTPVPGYKDLPPEHAGTGHPTGWSYRNLMREEYMPTKFETEAARIGRGAAAAYRPQVLTTRVGLEVGQYIMFDDMWHDFLVAIGGQRRGQRLLQFHALDVFSGCNFVRGMKPVLENEVTLIQERLKEREMLLLVAHVLTCYGYREKGTVLVVEHGTAAIRPEFEERIARLTSGKVTVERSGMLGSPAFAGVYAGSSKGNYRFKAALESMGSLIHNETSNILEIPGQTGSNSRVNAPEELSGRERHTDQLLRAMAALPPDRAALLRLPVLQFNMAAQLVHDIHDRINSRTEHDLQGWIEAELVAHEFRMAVGMPWLPAEQLLALSPEARRGVEMIIAGQDGLTNVRKLSPKEVFERGRPNLTRLPGHAIPALLGSKLGIHVEVKNNEIEFQDRTIWPEPMIFQSEVTTIEGNKFRIRDRTELLAYVDLDLSRVYLTDLDGSFRGTAARWDRISRADTEALHRQMGHVQKIEAEFLAPVARLGAEITRKRIADAQWNAGVLGAKKPLTDAERESNRRIKAEKGNLNDLIPEEHGVPQELIETAASAESEDISELL